MSIRIGFDVGMLTMLGIPVLYYGCEWGMEGIKGVNEDTALRPPVPEYQSYRIISYTACPKLGSPAPYIFGTALRRLPAIVCHLRPTGFQKGHKSGAPARNFNLWELPAEFEITELPTGALT